MNEKRRVSADDSKYNITCYCKRLFYDDWGRFFKHLAENPICKKNTFKGRPPLGTGHHRFADLKKQRRG